MYFEFLSRHLAVCSVNELPQIAARDKNFWNSISIMEPSRCLAPTKDLCEVLSLRFDDAENLDTEETGITFPKKSHILEALKFIDDHPGKPLLIQCWAGLSRSAAMALGLIARGLHKEGIEPFAEQAVQNLLLIRPQARPNVLVLKLVLETFLSTKEAEAATLRMLNHPTLLANRFIRNH